jgi:hypothetical protein
LALRKSFNANDLNFQTVEDGFEVTYVKARKRFRAFRCNAFAEDPAWQEMDASGMLEAEQEVFTWVNRN